MKIWIHKKTGETYPDHGGNFTHYPDYKVKPNKIYLHIKGNNLGWKYYPSKDWESKEIPDLHPQEIKQHPDTFRAYAKEYGINIAMAQLPCAEFCKSSWAAVLLDPQYPNDEFQKWFYETFNPTNIGDDIYPEFYKKTLWDFMVTSLGMIFGIYMFDIRRFEEHLASEFGYDPKAKQSISSFMIQKFGKENHDKFKKELIKKGLTSKNKKGKVTA
jgi:hypothetical protein